MENVRPCGTPIESPEPLRVTLSDWLVKNFKLPTDTPTLIVFIIIALLAWYIFNWVIRLFLTLMWPIFIVVSVVILMPYVRDGNLKTFLPNVLETAKEVIFKLVDSVKAVSSTNRN